MTCSGSVDEICKKIFDETNRRSIYCVDLNDKYLRDKGGFYGIFFKNGEKFSRIFHNDEFKYRDDNLLYIGISTNLSNRDLKGHFCSSNSSNSTVRRSIGAIEKEKLGLIPIPRRNGECSHYRYQPEGEEKLSKWMGKHLEVGYFPCVNTRKLSRAEKYELRKKLEDTEKKLINRLTPPLNIVHNQKISNGLEKLRNECRKLAKNHQISKS